MLCRKNYIYDDSSEWRWVLLDKKPACVFIPLVSKRREVCRGHQYKYDDAIQMRCWVAITSMITRQFLGPISILTKRNEQFSKYNSKKPTFLRSLELPCELYTTQIRNYSVKQSAQFTFWNSSYFVAINLQKPFFHSKNQRNNFRVS